MQIIDCLENVRATIEVLLSVLLTKAVNLHILFFLQSFVLPNESFFQTKLVSL